MSLWSPPAAAQPVDEFQIWNAFLSTARPWEEPHAPRLWLDVHGRRGDAGSVFIVRPALGLQLDPLVSLWAGYAWVPVLDDASGERFDEQRAWQQVILTHRFPSGWAIQSRTRFELRFGEGSDETGSRAREFVRVAWRRDDWPVGFVAWDELFVGLNEVDWGAPRGYDQNRVFVGVSWPLSEAMRFETGYLLVHLNREVDTLAHVLAVNLFASHGP